MSDEAWSLILLVLAGIGWVSTVTLVRAADNLPEAALQERATVAVMCSTAATFIGLLALALLIGFHMTHDAAQGLLILACVLINCPPILWGAMLLTGRFK